MLFRKPGALNFITDKSFSVLRSVYAFLNAVIFLTLDEKKLGFSVFWGIDYVRKV